MKTKLRFAYLAVTAVMATTHTLADDMVPDSIATQSLNEVVVTGQSARQRIADNHLGSEKLELAKLALTPQLFGETDIIKSMTLLPGVHAEAEGAGGFEVRGGNPYQNLVTVDGATLYNPSHMMGIFSTFNDDAMGHATLHKGPVPANFGGASSSVLETTMKPGSMDRYNFSGTIGILNAKIAADGPVIKDRLSLALAARRSYVDMFLKIIPQYRHTVMNFFDINAKMRYKADRTHTIDVSVFASRDNLAVSSLMGMHWGNIATSANWNARIADDWHVLTTAAFTNYTTHMTMNIMKSDQDMTQYIRNISLNSRAIHHISENHSLEFGVRSELLRVKSCEMQVNDSRQKEIRSGWQNAIWGSYEGSFSEKWSVCAGVRVAAFSALSGSCFHDFSAINETPPDFSAHDYIDIEPRGNIKFNINECHNIKGGASVTTQNIHGIRNATTTFPFDRYALTSANVKPEKAIQYSAGYSGMTPDGAWDWSAEAYYKKLNNVYDYRDGMQMFSRVALESIILGGRGRSYGLELMLRKNTGRLNGWVSYTLARTDTRIAGINDGRWYRASNDRRHHVALAAIYRLNDKWQLSASWTYSSGRPVTAPDAKYEVSGTTCYYYSSRNGYITPSSHRLDLSATYTRAGRRCTSIWSFGIFNAYAHYSPFIIYFEDDATKPSGTRAVQQSLFGIVPSVSYTIKF